MTEPETTSVFRKYRRFFIILAVVLFIGIAVLVYWLLTRGKESTDDALVQGHLIPVNARVSGYIRFVNVNDNEHVPKGHLLVQLDRRDLTARLRNALANLASQKAQAAAANEQVAVTQHTAPSTAAQAAAATAIAVEGVTAAQSQLVSAQAQVISAEANVSAARQAYISLQTDVRAATEQVASAKSGVKAAKAEVDSAKAEAIRQANEAIRYESMYGEGAVSRQQYEAVIATNTSAQAALAGSRARLAAAQIAVSQAVARLAGAQALAARAKAQVTSTRAALSQAKAALNVAETAVIQAQARLKQAQAAQFGAEVAPQQIKISEAQRRAQLARIAQAEADVRNARLQLAYTAITSSVEGHVTQKSAEPGQYVQPGQALMAIVPLRNVWVVANFKETQVRHMRPGQRASISVDTYSGLRFKARVQSIEAATQEEFSLLPAQNATGNFVKVVHRVPVKIVFDKPFPKGVVLRPGMNVIATVYL